MLQLNRSEFKEAYRRMRTIREFEERLHVEFSNGQIPGFVHLYAGEEASAVGVCQQLRPKGDHIASTHRGHGHCIAKGCDVEGMMLEIFGKDGGLCNGKGGSMHIADLDKGMMGANGIVGGGPPLICGAAPSVTPRSSGRMPRRSAAGAFAASISRAWASVNATRMKGPQANSCPSRCSSVQSRKFIGGSPTNPATHSLTGWL